MFSAPSRRPLISVSTIISQVRFTAKTRQKKISVQLLKNVEGLGVKGEIVQVKPTHMMNWLQFHNRACFILPGQGPRIPIVDRSKELRRVGDEKRKLAQVKQEQKIREEAEAAKVKLEDLNKLTGLNF